ncbi:hypothetical protein LY76DRAFT_586221 [Colletotrichum caudatum]|nr:hypothetical protein LY76DRAFT_586221 [Colletotrichum caudatum]
MSGTSRSRINSWGSNCSTNNTRLAGHRQKQLGKFLSRFRGCGLHAPAVLDFFSDGDDEPQGSWGVHSVPGKKSKGDDTARWIAEQGKEWAEKVLRREDMRLYNVEVVAGAREDLR